MWKMEQKAFNKQDIVHMRQVVHGNNRLTIWLIASKLGMNHNNIWKIITEDLDL